MQPSTEPWHLDTLIRVMRINELDWRYIDTGGSGPALIMLPGSVGTCEMFFKQIGSLSGAIRIIAVSYPAQPDPTLLADGLAALMTTLGLARASVLGSSFGGYWAQFVALRHPARVETLFLGNIFITPDELFTNPLFDPDWVPVSYTHLDVYKRQGAGRNAVSRQHLYHPGRAVHQSAIRSRLGAGRERG